MDQTTLEQRQAEARRVRGIVDGFPVHVYHPVYAPTLPSACDTPEELQRLLSTGWYTSPEAMHAGTPAVPAKPAAATTVPFVSKVTDEMIANALAGTVSEVAEFVLTIENETELDRIEAAEKSGAARVGVQNAIDKQREEVRRG